MEKKFTRNNQSVPTPEKEKKEYIPTQEAVLEIFQQLIGDKKYEILKKQKDEEGLCLWDIKIETKDGWAVYSYRRKLPANEKLPRLRIDVVYYKIVGGGSVAKYDEEKKEWKLTP